MRTSPDADLRLAALDQSPALRVQALHYKELEYQSSPLTAAESLIHILNQLRLPDAAQGILNHTIKVEPDAESKIGANWYEKLRMYDTALSQYRKQQQVRHCSAPLCQKKPKGRVFFFKCWSRHDAAVCRARSAPCLVCRSLLQAGMRSIGSSAAEWLITLT